VVGERAHCLPRPPRAHGKMNDLYMATCSTVALGAHCLPVLAEGMSLAATAVGQPCHWLLVQLPAGHRVKTEFIGCENLQVCWCAGNRAQNGGHIWVPASANFINDFGRLDNGTYF
jgi:hypothetical protein